MGIRGLFTYVHNNSSFWINISQILEENKRSDEGQLKIIIDGPNLANQLHKFANLDSLYGGQYQEFYETVRGFLEAVRNTGFTPIVVLGEMMEERKRNLILTRRVEKLNELNRCVHNGERVIKLPQMGYITFTQAVLDLEIEYVMCDTEADPVISALALTLNAYVLSSDSDFFFTSVPGVFSIEFLSWKDGVLVGSFYRLEYFLQFHGLQLWNVPFIVMMLGNDFIPPGLFQVIGSVREETINQLSGSKISRVLQMITSFKTETVLMGFFQSRLSAPQWRDFQHYYSTTVSSYLHPNSLQRIDPSLPHYGLEYTNIRERSDVSLKSLLRVEWAWCALFHRETLAQCNVEHFQRDPATDCSLNIRAYTYSFILNGGHLVEIGHTNSLSLKYSRIELLETLPNSSPVPNLDEILKLPESDRLEIFLQIIQCSNPRILQLKDPWRLLAFTLAYWYSHCKPRPTKSLVESIIVSCVIAHKHHWKDYSNFPRDIKGQISHHLLPYHQVSQWHATQHDIYMLAMVLCLPLLSPRIFYNGRLLFQIIIDSEFREDQLNKFMDERNELWVDFFTDLIVSPSNE